MDGVVFDVFVFKYYLCNYFKDFLKLFLVDFVIEGYGFMVFIDSFFFKKIDIKFLEM